MNSRDQSPRWNSAWWVRLAALVVGAVLLPAAPASSLDPEVDWLRHDDPRMESPEAMTVFDERLLPLWLEALARPEADLKRLAAQAIVRARRLDMPGLSDAVPALMVELQRRDPHPVVLQAVSSALIELEAREAAPLMVQHAAGSLELAQIVEPALARWKFEPVRAVWLHRLQERSAVSRSLVLAMRGLAELGAADGHRELLAIATSQSAPATVRIEAARALGRLVDSGLDQTAARLAAHASPAGLVDRLAAASMLGRHDNPAARQLLASLARDDEAAVAVIALERLFEIDPALVLELVVDVIARDDAKVRFVAARALAAKPTAARIALLGTMLDDPVPELRRHVRRSLVELAAISEHREAVLDAGRLALAEGQWRALEQATQLLVALEHKPAADAIVTLLDHARPEVFVTAAWALRKLAVPDTLPAMHDRLARVTDRCMDRANKEPVPDLFAHYQQIAQLCEAFGEAKYKPADGVMRRYIPKHATGLPEPREAAIWALGHLWAGNPQPELVAQLVSRFTDESPMDPEELSVRVHSAISLGRMGASSAIPTLRQFAELYGHNNDLGQAALWALQQMTGEPLPARQPRSVAPLGWFIEPLPDEVGP